MCIKGLTIEKLELIHRQEVKAKTNFDAIKVKPQSDNDSGSDHITTTAIKKRKKSRKGKNPKKRTTNKDNIPVASSSTVVDPEQGPSGYASDVSNCTIINKNSNDDNQEDMQTNNDTDNEGTNNKEDDDKTVQRPKEKRPPPIILHKTIKLGSH